MRDDNPSIEEKYTPGTRIECVNLSTNMLLAGTVMDIPFPTAVADSNLSDSPHPYNVMFDNGMTTSISLLDMSDLILKLPMDIDASNSQDSLLPPFLHLNSKNMYKHEGLHLKGFLGEHIKNYQIMFNSLTPNGAYMHQLFLRDS